MTNGLALRCVTSSAAASGPRMTLTLSRSISSCALVLVPAGLPPVSAETNSILRPPNVLFFCLRKVAMPCSIWMPPWASGPVLTVSRPTLKGAPCAIAGMPTAAAAVPAAVPAKNFRRLSVIDIESPPWFTRLRDFFLSTSWRRGVTPSSAKVFRDVKPGIVIGAIHNPIAVDEYVGGLNDAGAVRPVIDEAARRGRNERADLDRPVLIADIEHAHARVLIRREDQLRAHEAAGPVLVDIVRTEMRAIRHVVRFGRRREGRDAHRILRRTDVEQPDQLEAILLVIEHGFVEHDQQIAVGQRQAVVRAAAEGRGPVAMDDQFWRAAVGDVDHHKSGVAPCAVGGVAVDDGVMQTVAPGRRPARRLARGLIHAGQPVPARLARLRRVAHVDGDENIVGEAV